MAQNAKGRGKNSPRHNGGVVLNGHHRNWMTASPVSWVGSIIAVLSLVGMIGQYFTTFANLQAQVTTISVKIEGTATQFKLDLDRNFKEDDRRAELVTRALERLATQIDGFQKLYTKIEVLEEKLGAINDTLKRIERQNEKAVLKGSSK